MFSMINSASNSDKDLISYSISLREFIISFWLRISINWAIMNFKPFKRRTSSINYEGQVNLQINILEDNKKYEHAHKERRQHKLVKHSCWPAP